MHLRRMLTLLVLTSVLLTSGCAHRRMGLRRAHRLAQPPAACCDAASCCDPMPPAGPFAP